MLYTSVRSDILGHKKKKLRAGPNEKPVPVVFLSLREGRGTNKHKKIKALLDSGASGSIFTQSSVGKLNLHKESSTSWNTAAGVFSTSACCKVEFLLPEFSQTRTLRHKVHVSKQPLTSYDAILGRDILNELGMDLMFSRGTILWGDLEIPMKPSEICTVETSFHVEDSRSIQNSLSRVKTILDANYHKADLHEVVTKVDTLDNSQQSKLEILLRKFESLFDGKLGEWKGEDYHITLKDGVKPYHAKPFAVPKAYEKVFRKEVERLVQIGVLRKVNRSEWAAPCFCIPKKNQTIRFLSDFRELNKRINRFPFPIPKIQRDADATRRI